MISLLNLLNHYLLFSSSFFCKFLLSIWEISGTHCDIHSKYGALPFSIYIRQQKPECLNNNHFKTINVNKQIKYSTNLSRNYFTDFIWVMRSTTKKHVKYTQ